MGVLLSLGTADFGPASYKRRRAAKRVGIKADHFVELYEPTTRQFAYAAASAGSDPLRLCHSLAYELDSWPATEAELAEASALSDDGSALTQEETE